MQQLVSVALGGALGALARHAVGVWAVSAWGERFPWGTFVVNAVGCLLLGLLAEGFTRTEWGSPMLRVMLTTGFLGAFTTFSTYSVQTLRLLERGDVALAAANALGQLGVGLGLAWLGVRLARAIS